jgi:tetratricopeptide (TPR) repeat protein
MEGKPMKTTTSVLALVAAALLLSTPPAGARTNRERRKTNPAADKLLSEGLGDLQAGQDSAAIGLFTRAAQDGGGARAYFLLGWAHYQRGFQRGSVATADPDDAQSALDAYALARSADPSFSVIDASRLYFSGALCYEALGDYDRALASYKSALRAAPGKALIALNAARLRLKMKNEDKAVANTLMALRLARAAGREGDLLALVRRGPAFAPLLADAQTRRALGVSRDAELVALAADVRGGELRDSVRDDPAAVPAPPVQDQAVLDKIASGDADLKYDRYPDAIGAYGAALELDRTRRTLSIDQTAGIDVKIGYAYDKLGDGGEAVGFLLRALQLRPDRADARYQLALAYALSGRTADSLRALQRSFASASGTAELRRLVLLAKTDTELAAVRDLPGFRSAVASVAERVALR